MAFHSTADMAESAALAEKGRLLLERELPRLDGLRSRIDGLRVFSASPLADGDDLAAGITREVPSDQIRHLLLSAFDHLRFLSVYVNTQQSIPPLAGYTLVRTSIESSALALWLLESSDRDKRLICWLRLIVANLGDSVSFSNALGLPVDPAIAVERRAIEVLRAKRPMLRDKSLDDMPDISWILERVEGSAMMTRGVTGLTAWRACSAIAHSNKRVTQQLSSHSLGTTVTGETKPEFSVRLSTFAKFFQVAMNYLESAVLAFETKSQALGS